MNLSWLRDFTGPVYVVIYEDLQRDLEREVKGIAKFLRVTPTYVECAVQNAQGEYRRKKKKPVDYREHYSEELKAVAKSNVLDVDRALRSSSHVTMSGGLASHYNLTEKYQSTFVKFSPNSD